MLDDFYDILENEESLGNQLEGKIDIDDIPGISSSNDKEDIPLPISEIYEDTPLDENEPALPIKQNSKIFMK